jgi:hypothetical protein
MQVLVEESELKRMRQVARTRGMTLAEWVRQTLRSALRTEPSGAADKKLARLRASLGHAFPAPDIDQMLAEIEQGYAGRRK